MLREVVAPCQGATTPRNAVVALRLVQRVNCRISKTNDFIRVLLQPNYLSVKGVTTCHTLDNIHSGVSESITCS